MTAAASRRRAWIDPDPAPVTADHVAALHDAVRAQAPGAAVLLTSFHQSPLPLALLLRLAGVGWIGAINEDYPGSLLDLRHHVDGDPPEAQRALGLAHAAGYPLPPGDEGRLAVRRPLPDVEQLTGGPGYVVVHPGASVPAREWPAQHCTQAVRALAAAGHRVVVTGSAREQHLTALVAADVGIDLGGRTDLHTLAAVLDGACVAVAGNTGPAHLAAAVGTPVVSLFAPVVPARRWAPYGVPMVVLGDQDAPCRDTPGRGTAWCPAIPACPGSIRLTSLRRSTPWW